MGAGPPKTTIYSQYSTSYTFKQNLLFYIFPQEKMLSNLLIVLGAFLIVLFRVAFLKLASQNRTCYSTCSYTLGAYKGLHCNTDRIFLMFQKHAHIATGLWPRFLVGLRSQGSAPQPADQCGCSNCSHCGARFLQDSPCSSRGPVHHPTSYGQIRFPPIGFFLKPSSQLSITTLRSQLVIYEQVKLHLPDPGVTPTAYSSLLPSSSCSLIHFNLDHKRTLPLHSQLQSLFRSLQ